MRKKNPVHFTLALALFHYLVLEAVRPYISLRAEACGASGVQIGLIVAAYSIVQVVCALLVGKALDRWGIRRPALLGAIAFVGSALLLASTGRIPLIMVSTMMMGLSHGILLLALEALMTGLSDPVQRANGIGILTFFNSVGIFAGPTLGGWMQTLLGVQGAFVGCAGLALLPAILCFMLPDHPECDAASGAPAVSIWELLHDRRVINVLVLSACTFFALDVMSTYFPLHCAAVGLTSAAIGYVLSAKGLAQMAIRVCLGQLCKRFGQQKVFAVSLTVGAISTALLGILNNFWLLIAMAVIVGMALGLTNPLTLMSVSDISTDQTRSRILALRLMFGFGAQAASPIVFGFISDRSGLPPVFLGSGLIMLLCVLLSSRMSASAARSASCDQ